MAKNYYRKQKPKYQMTKGRVIVNKVSPRCNSITNAGTSCKMPVIMSGKCIYHQHRRTSRQKKQSSLRRWQ